VSGASPRGDNLAERAFERILLIKPSSLGDVIHALPVLHGLRTRYPAARIDWLIATAHAALLEGHPELTGLVRFDRDRYARLWRSPRAASQFCGFLRDLRHAQYDLVIDLQGLFRSGFFARATAAPVRIGFRDAREGAACFYTHHLPVDLPDTHAVDRNYRVAGLLGFADVPIAFPLALSETDEAEAGRLLAAAGVNAARKLVVLVPGARWETKRWPTAHFAGLIDALAQDERVQCVLLGGPGEAALCAEVVAGCRTAPAQLVGRTTLPQLAALLARADLVVCHDSAAAHLAAALDRPLICLTGPTNPSRTGPYRHPEAVVRLPLDCSPCYYRRLSQCGFGHRCLRELSVDLVVEAVRRVRA